MAAVVIGRGITLEYEDMGDRDAPPVLLIMGLGAQLTLWPDVFCQALVGQGYRVIRYDNRDIGLSSKVQEGQRYSVVKAMVNYLLDRKVEAPYTLEDMAEDTVGLMDALGLESAHVIGASMGGMIAHNLAARHPERVRSLISIMSTSGNRKLPLPKLRFLLRLIRRPSSAEHDILVRYVMATLKLINGTAFPYEDEELRDLVSRTVDRSYYPTGILRQFMAVLAAGSQVPLLEKITAPTLVIHGSADLLVPLAGGKDTAAHIPGAELKIIEGMGHGLPPILVPTLVAGIEHHIRRAEARAQQPVTTNVCAELLRHAK